MGNSEYDAFEDRLRKMKEYIEKAGNSKYETSDLYAYAKEYIPELVDTLLIALKDLKDLSVCRTCQYFAECEVKTVLEDVNPICYVWRGLREL